MFSDAGWVGPTLLTIAVVCAVGGALRAVPVPQAVIPVVQTTFFVVTMAYVLPSEPGSAGERLAAFRDLVSGSASAVGSSMVPVPSTPEIVALLVVGIFLAALVVEMLVVGLGWAGGSGAVLLAMAAVPVGLTSQGFVLLTGPAVGWLLLMAADQWARLRAQQRTGSAAKGAAGSGVGLLAITSASLVCSGLVLALVAPAPGRLPWLLALSDSGGARNSPASGTLDPFVDIREQLQPGNRQEQVLSYRSSDGRAAYLGMVTLELFNGESWAPYPRVAGTDSAVALPPGGGTGPTFDIEVANLGNPYLPIPDYARVVTVAGESGSWTWHPRTSDVISLRTAARGQAYQVQTFEGAPEPAALAAAGSQGPGVSGATRYLPGDLQAAVEQTAIEVTAGSTSTYDRALKLQEWFSRTGGFVYTLAVPDPGARDPVVAFLADRQGFCQQYATAMAVLARSLQIPARVVVGFAGGARQDDGGFVVAGADAHAWPELWFDGIGWVRFEPTPAAVNPSLAPPDYALTTAEAPQAPAPLPSAADTPDDATALPEPESGADGSGGRASAVVAACVLGVLALIALAAPRAVRRKARSGRLADLAQGDAAAAWAEIRDTAVDAGIAWAPGATTRQQAAGLVAAVDPPPAGEAVAAWPALHSVVAAVEERLYAPAMRRTSVPEYRAGSATILDEPWMQPGPNDLVADVAEVLQRLDDLPRPLLGRLFPRSVRRRAARR